jgi:hypothetical protein
MMAPPRMPGRANPIFENIPFGPFGCFAAFLLLAVVLFIVSAYQAKKRREALAAVAAQLGFNFSPHASPDVFGQYEGMGLVPFGQGRSQRASNLLFGQRSGLFWEFFDYQYTTGSGKNRHTHHYGIAAAKVPMAFPPTRIRPEGMFDKLKGLFGFEDINFESEEFSRRYHVSCAERQRAFDLIHPRMIEFLLGIEARDWQLSGPVLMLVRGGTHRPPDILRSMQLIEQFLSLVPQYLRQDLAAGR